MGTTHFSGPIYSAAGFQTGTDVVAAPITAATFTPDIDTYNGELIPLDRAAGVTVTLPASSGSQAVYTFVVNTALSSNNHIVKVANSTDVMNGMASIAGTTGAAFTTLPASDTVTMNATTTGGLSGSFVRVTDYKSGFWRVEVSAIGSGTPATPFSATV